jgi:2-hydroxy-6-oxonona-2,4-dienedioate hydrolase
MTRPNVERRDVEILGQVVSVYEGGAGPLTLLLVHGGWGGARLHWSPVWDRLAQRYRVIAPDLPGLGQLETPPLRSLREYAEWLVTLMNLLDVERAWLVGNSFGASIAWSLAGRAPERCAGTVLVNGQPLPRTPLPLLVLGRSRGGALIVRSLLRVAAYNPLLLRLAFVDQGRVPAGLQEMLAQPESLLLRRYAALITEGDDPPAPRARPLLLFGDGDRLPGTSRAAANRLHRSLPGSTLTFVHGAGHFPQIEEPAGFARAIDAWVESVP